MAEIVFQIDHQIIQRVDKFKVVSDSRNYLYARFEFLTSEWADKLPTAVFQNANDSYEVILDQGNTCLVPWEVLERSAGNFTVTVFAGDLVTVNSAQVRVHKSGYASEFQPDPTPSVYEQIVERLDDIENMDVVANLLPEGSEPTASYDSGLMTFGIPKGDTGEQGPKGDKGETGDIGPMGPVGPKGDKGDKGETGDVGPKGDKGDRGNTGPQGVRGERGYTGPRGDIGPAGPKGDKGDTGEQGPKGEKGETGDVGPKGDKGDPGEVTQAEFDELAEEVTSLKSDLSDKAPAITNIASGSIAHFKDGADANARSVIAHIEPIQEGSGDPSPENVRPISGFTWMNVQSTGDNLYDFDSGEYNQPVYDVGGSMARYQDVSSLWIKVKPNTTYICTCIPPTQMFYFRWINCTKDKKFISRPRTQNSDNLPVSITTPANAEWVQIAINQYDTPNISKNDWKVCISETATSYVPFTGSTLPITFPSEAGTVYGGYVDVTNGKLVVDRAMVIIDSSWDTAISSTGETVTVAMYNNAYLPGIASKALPVSNRFSTNIASGQIGRMVYGAPNFYLAVPTSELTSVDVAGLKSWFSSHETHVCYKLATPITYDITPIQIATLLGVNNVWNDANGDTDVEYKADTKLYIEQLTKPTEDDMVANSNIANGTFFMVGGNRLFLSTTSIAVGETIIPGTNCTELSLADALNNLNA